jgi:hypothetical protein
MQWATEFEHGPHQSKCGPPLSIVRSDHDFDASIGLGQAIRAAAEVDAMLLSETRTDSTGPEGFILGFSGFSSEALSEAATSLAQAARRYTR